jgi:FHS family glucose/mannose:H+ symporter-like MFS transporter
MGNPVERPVAPSLSRAATLESLLLFVAMGVFLALYGPAGWVATSPIAQGADEAAAANWTAAFWAAMTVGRVLAIPLALRIPPHTW